jgi:hypothetical protein
MGTFFKEKKMNFVRYLFLGDSYTCCEKENMDINRWPLQLAAKLCGEDLMQSTIVCDRREAREKDTNWISDFELRKNKSNSCYAKIKIIARPGIRADELLDGIILEKKFLAKHGETLTDCDAIFILIGATDQFQRSEDGIEQFKMSFKKILLEAISAITNNDYAKIGVLSIPDWSSTPAGKNIETHEYRTNQYRMGKLSTEFTVRDEITQYNLVIKSIIDEFNRNHYSQINFVHNIENISREFGLFQEMTQTDGLHYSWGMTKKWNEEIFLSMNFLLKPLKQFDKEQSQATMIS